MIAPKTETRGLLPRLIARLDIKAPNLVKGVHMEGLRVIGRPEDYAAQYYTDGADELLYIDIVASLYQRNSLADLISATAEHVFLPMTVGGGVRTVDDIYKLLRAGADKVAINTAAIQRPELIKEASRIFGSQCVVVSIEAKQRSVGGWEAYTDNGREKTGVDVVDWVRRAVDLGAGEILLTSVDRDGTRAGLDLDLLGAVAPITEVPIILSGGVGSVFDVGAGLRGGAGAVAIGSLLHYRVETIASIKGQLARDGIETR